MRFLYCLYLCSTIVFGQVYYWNRELATTTTESNKNVNVNINIDVRKGLIIRISCNLVTGYNNLWEVVIFSLIPDKDVVNYYDDGKGVITHEFLTDRWVKTYNTLNVYSNRDPPICNDPNFLRT